jgi:hypothetical protein
MTLEQRLSDALHEVDSFDPSPDLFARVARSVEEDAAHRRRAQVAWLAAVGSLAAVVVYLGLMVTRSRAGSLIVPGWALELLEKMVSVGLVFLLAPVIRRFGGQYVSDVFRLDPATGTRFMRLLDIAYYLILLGFIIANAEVTPLGRPTLLRSGLESVLDGLASLLLLVGALHAANLMVLPVVGLVFSSAVRRAARHRAGIAAPPVSPKAVQADRVSSWIVWLSTVLLFAAVLLTIGIVIGTGLGR